jgi:hypothetical protein
MNKTVNVVLSLGCNLILAAKLCLLELATNVATWTELTNFKMHHFDLLAPPQIMAPPARIDVFFPFCCIVARLLGCAGNTKSLQHLIDFLAQEF